jgi:4-aminobutyrate aminotransferase and related aminotransferases
VGKGIGGGVAVAAVMGRADAMNWKPDSYTSTFLTNNLNLAAAIAAIGVLREEQLAGRAAAIGPAGLARMRARSPASRACARCAASGSGMPRSSPMRPGPGAP